MLFIVIGLVIFAASLNAEKVADWYWDIKYQNDRNAAEALLEQDLVCTTAMIEKSPNYADGDLLTFNIRTPDGPLQVSSYQPRALERGYVRQAYPGGSLVVYYNRRFPRNCVLSPSVTTAKGLLHKKKPQRVPDDYISRFVGLWGKVMAAFLVLIGVQSMKAQNRR